MRVLQDTNRFIQWVYNCFYYTVRSWLNKMCLGSRSTNYFQNNLKNALAKVSPMHKIKQIPYACENISSLNWTRSPHWGDPIALNYVSLNLASQTDIVWLRQKDISRHNSSKEIFVWIQTHVPAHTHTHTHTHKSRTWTRTCQHMLFNWNIIEINHS